MPKIMKYKGKRGLKYGNAPGRMEAKMATGVVARKNGKMKVKGKRMRYKT